MSVLVKRLVVGILAVLSLHTHASERAEWRDKMQSIIPQGYLCHFATNGISVDGDLNDADWVGAQWTSDFGDIVGPSKPKPRFRTRAKMLWDEKYLYVCAELEEPHVWGTLTNHDSVIFRDPDFEVFVDPQGSTHNYYEFEMNALNTGWDLRLDKPYLDRGKPHNEWNIPGLKTAVHIRGTINNSSDVDQGWNVELAFPWKALEVYAHHSGPPKEGEQWRINFSRVEWQISITNGAYLKKPNTAEDNWVWSPTGVVDMHRPEMWGLLEFTREGKSARSATAQIPGKPARDAALEVYHMQRDFRGKHNRWAQTLNELGWATNELPAAIESIELLPTADGYVCSTAYQDSTGHHTWRIRQDRLIAFEKELPVETELFVSEAGKAYGDRGRRAAWFLVDNMPASDRGILSKEFLMNNLELAMKARTNFSWARDISEPMFLNDVLPYASLDEPRDEWRSDFYKLAGEIVRDCKSGGEAAQVLNRDLFKRINVHYNTGRKRNNQSPAESIEQGKATCTGLAIILVDACRAVGVPARIAGVPQWAQKEGNHTWAEYWDGDWHFLGADEYDKNGPDRAWFNNDAAITIAMGTNSINQIYGSSWRRTGAYFPLAWDFDSRDVPGIDVSYRYANLAPSTNSAFKAVHARLRERTGGARVAANVELRSTSDVLISTNRTRPESADLNDMPKFELPDDAVNVYLRFTRNGESREKMISCAACARSQTFDISWDELTPVSTNLLAAEAWLERTLDVENAPKIELSGEESKRIAGLAWEKTKQAKAEVMRAELDAKKITIGNDSLRWMEKTFGDAPFGKRSLWITLHGGGEAPAEANDRNWRGYYGRYEFPPGSINVAPRAPANTWNMWFVKPVDGLLDRLIADMIAQRGVDANQVYLIGYSAGGDGVYQLSPRLADRFAAATMCAGHPNQITPEGLRNLPFFLYMGGEDAAYHRNTVVREFNAKIDALYANDSAGYVHRCTVFPGLMHDMQGREAEAIPRMAELRRDVWPKRVIWKQDENVLHHRFYWMERSAQDVKPNEIYAAHIAGQQIEIEQPTTGNLTLRLSDAMLDLDQPIQVVASGRKLFEGKAIRSFESIVKSLKERQDPGGIALATLSVSW